MAFLTDLREAIHNAREEIQKSGHRTPVLIITDEYRAQFKDLMDRLVSGYAVESQAMMPCLYGIPIEYRKNDLEALSGIFHKYDTAVLFRGDYFLSMKKEDVMKPLYPITPMRSYHEQITEIQSERWLHSGKGIPNCIPESVA